MTLFILFVVGLFVGLIFGYLLLKGKIENTERYLGELDEYIKELVGFLKRKYEPSAKDLQENSSPKTSKKNGNGEVKAALSALGYKSNEINSAVSQLSESLSIEDKVKTALQYLNKG